MISTAERLTYNPFLLSLSCDFAFADPSRPSGPERSHVSSRITAATADETIWTTDTHAMSQTMMLILPVGAQGNARAHSTYTGTQPLGSQNRGSFEYQSCKTSRRPLVLLHRTIAIVLPNELRKSRSDSARCDASQPMNAAPKVHAGGVGGMQEHGTFLIVGSERLVVLAIQLGPPGELVLGASSSQFALQADDLPA